MNGIRLQVSTLFLGCCSIIPKRERERERESVQDIEGLSRKGVGILVRIPLKKIVGVVVECHLDTVYVFKLARPTPAHSIFNH